MKWILTCSVYQSKSQKRLHLSNNFVWCVEIPLQCINNILLQELRVAKTKHPILSYLPANTEWIFIEFNIRWGYEFALSNGEWFWAYQSMGSVVSGSRYCKIILWDVRISIGIPDKIRVDMWKIVAASCAWLVTAYVCSQCKGQFTPENRSSVLFGTFS